MKFTSNQFTEIAFLFERANGNIHSDYERKIINESSLKKIDRDYLKEQIIDGINSKIYADAALRTNAYWALSKLPNPNLIPNLRKWLKLELENNEMGTLFQIMIALSNLEEPVFSNKRSGFAFDEIELNRRDAQQYLNENSM